MLGSLLAWLPLALAAAFAQAPAEVAKSLDCPSTTSHWTVTLRAPDRYTFVRGVDECWLADGSRTTENPLRAYVRFDPLREAASTAEAAMKWAIEQQLVREPASVVEESTVALDGQETPWAIVRGRNADGRGKRDVAVLSLANGKIVVAAHYDTHHRADEDRRAIELFRSVTLSARTPEISSNQ